MEVIPPKNKPKPVLHFKQGHKRLPLPKCCAKVIAGAYGKDTDGWIGKSIIIFPTTCDAFGETGVECVRVKI